MNNASETTATIAKQLASAQMDMRNASLDSENPHFKSRYASLAAIRDATVPVLAAHGIAVVQGTHVDGELLIAYTRLAHGDEWYESTYPIAIEKPQQMGSAITYAKRYMLAAMCGIAAEDDDDGNAAQQGGSVPKARKAEPEAPPKANAAQLQQIKNLYMPLSADLSEPEKKACKEALKGESAERAESAIKFLTERASEKVSAP